MVTMTVCSIQYPISEIMSKNVTYVDATGK